MGAFLKMAGLAVVIAAGSMVALWQAFAGHPAVAGLALLVTFGLSFAVIAMLTRDTGRAGRAPR